MEALKAGGAAAGATNAENIFESTKELLTLHELIAHRLVQVLIGSHNGRKFFGA
jgi:hypothetical protein